VEALASGGMNGGKVVTDLIRAEGYLLLAMKEANVELQKIEEEISKRRSKPSSSPTHTADVRLGCAQVQVCD